MQSKSKYKLESYVLSRLVATYSLKFNKENNELEVIYNFEQSNPTLNLYGRKRKSITKDLNPDMQRPAN